MTGRPGVGAGWRRAISEVVTIVVGISIALGADAAWEEHVDRVDERAALRRLHDDFQRSTALLDSVTALHEADLASLERLMELILSAGDPAGSYEVPDSILIGVYRTSAWTPPMGSVTSLLNSGDLRLIRNDSLRAELTAWPEVVSNIAGRESASRAHYEQFQLPLTHEYVPWASLMLRSGPHHYGVASRASGDYRGLLNSLSFENTIEWRVSKEVEILAEYTITERRLNVILELLARELGAS